MRFTNEFGSNPLAIGAARIALSADKSSIQAETDRSLNFSGENSAQIPAGSILLSDPVELNVPPLSDVAVSLYLPCQHLEHSTFHDEALQVNYLGTGNQTSAQTVHNSTELDSWYFLDGVDVEESGGSPGAVVALGDSLTEGAYSGVSKNHRWTDFLAKRLQENKITAQLGVLNEGIGGNRLLHDGYGPSALARFNRDVLAQSDLRFLIVLEGTNDIGHLVKPPVAKVTAHELETALAQIATRAHAAGIKVYGATMLPYFGASYYSEDGEKIREEVNAWIREGSAFDAVIDFDKAIRDPQDVKRILPGYDHGDHLHLNEQGYKAMADAIDLHLFK
ncbi:MAG TPA: SGNH/GDSL hydrolase family protein [Terracidiphilus sp.]|nr:SGNH/GDSL hydrolase family protein [Terracidiphilus sp.]